MKRLLFFILGLPLALVLALAAGVVIPHPSGWWSDNPDDCLTQTVYVTTNGVHTDIGFRVGDLPELDFITQLSPSSVPTSPDDILAFGWGERIFYLEVKEWGDLTLDKALQAVFASPGALMHVSLYPSHMVERRFKVCQDQWVALLDSIERSFVKVESLSEDRIVGYGPRDWFYPATGHYSPFYTCNSWTVSQLRRIGVRTPFLSQFAPPVLWHLPNDQPGD